MQTRDLRCNSKAPIPKRFQTRASFAPYASRGAASRRLDHPSLTKKRKWGKNVPYCTAKKRKDIIASHYNAASRWTSPDRASQPTMRSLKPSVAASGPNASMLVPVPCGCQEKVEDWRRYYNEERPHAGDWQKAADFAYSKCQSVTELNWRQPARIGLLEQLAPSPIEGRQSDN
jgi:hypothetical protein